MCEPISIGIAIGAATGAAGAAATGGDVLQGALLGGIGGGFAGAGAGMFGNMATNLALGATSTGVATATSVGVAGGLIGGATSTLGSVAMSTLFPTPEFPTYDVPQQTAQVQQFNSQQIATTGSGGRQATASLAEAIKRSKQRKLSQADVGDLSIDTSAFASTGLQLA